MKAPVESDRWASEVLRVVGIGLACAIGAHFGRKLAMLFGFCLLLCTPIKGIRAQVFYGDTSRSRVGDETRGYFYLDTLTYVGHKKSDPRKPWVYQITPSWLYYAWWMETADCQGFRTDVKQFRKFRFFAVNAESFGTTSPFLIGYGGYTLIDSMAVYVSARNLNSRIVLQHEMTHLLMFLNGEGLRHTLRRFGLGGCSFGYVTPEDADPEYRGAPYRK